MAKVDPLPAGMLSPGLEGFIRELPVQSVEVHDRHGLRTYAPPGPETPSEGAPEDQGVVTPGWAASAPEAPPGAPEPGPEVPPPAPRLMFNQPNPGPPVGEGRVVEDEHGVTLVFNQPLEPEEAPEGQDLTLEERVEWLEEALRDLGYRVARVFDHNNLGDGS